MIDFHTHILPGVDDGSQSVEQSIEMLRMEAAQGITEVVLTPHFYAMEDNPQRFLARRQKAYDTLLAAMETGLPRLRLGAEVQYFEGLCSAEQLGELCIDGTRLLLLEMPFCPWTERMVENVLELNMRSELQVVLAHIERYLHWQSRDTLPWLLDEGVLMQCNASFFLEFSSRGRAMRMLREGQIHFLGSDCHGLTARPPQVGMARERIVKKLGTAEADRLIGYGNIVLDRNKI